MRLLNNVKYLTMFCSFALFNMKHTCEKKMINIFKIYDIIICCYNKYVNNKKNKVKYKKQPCANQRL